MTDHVKIYGIKPRIQYVADGTSTEYEFPFAIFKTSDIDVYFGDVKQETTSYTVSEARHSDGGTVTFTSAPASGTIITIVRNLSIERTSDFQEGSTLRAKVLNDELDYQIACQQQIAENLNRSMSLPPYADSDVDLTLPTPCAGKAVVWNSAGTALENSSVSVNALESTLNGYKIAAESAASMATTKAGIASDKADIATTQAQTASTQAGIATTKAVEATSAVNQLNGMRTNCITEIPQNINLTLSSGTLTLKAGSKVYLPNGSGMFDTLTIASDITKNDWGNITGVYMCLVNAAGTYIYAAGENYSGTSTESVSGVYYRTDSNYIYPNNNAASGKYSFPIALITLTNGVPTSIEKAFNGFGYIGSTIFSLPGIKGLIPNGKNTDGTLKNTVYITTSVGVGTVSGTHNTHNICLMNNNTLGVAVEYQYNSDTNYVYNSSTGSNYTNRLIIGTLSSTSGTITSFNIKPVFHAIDYNDAVKYSDNIVSWGMPDFTAGVSFTSGGSTTKPCLVVVKALWNGSEASLTAPLNIQLSGVIYNGNNNYRNDVCFMCDANETITFTNATCTVYPLKGV